MVYVCSRDASLINRKENMETTPVEPEEPDDEQEEQPDPVDHIGGEPDFPT